MIMPLVHDYAFSTGYKRKRQVTVISTNEVRRNLAFPPEDGSILRRIRTRSLVASLLEMTGMGWFTCAKGIIMVTLAIWQALLFKF